MSKTTFENLLIHQPWMIRRKFNKLSNNRRLAVGKAFERHRRACARTGCDIDPHWIFETVNDVAKGLWD